MIEVHVYGRLRQLLPDSDTGHARVLHVTAQPDESLGALLARLGIPRDALYTIFLNGGLLATRNRMARWLVYPQAQPNASHWDTDTIVRDGDRIGLFGEDMPSLVV